MAAEPAEHPVLVRLSPPHEAMRARFAEALSRTECGPRP